MYVLTQFMSVSLHRHIRQAYRFDPFSGGFVEILAAQQTMEAGTEWYQGTADAVRKNLRYIQQSGVSHVLILSGDQLYRMDYREMMKTHEASGADVTIAGLPVSRADARSLGIMRLDESGRVVGFLEKPQTDDEIDIVRMDPAWIDARGIPSRGRDCVANMGIYLFNRETLEAALDKTPYADFGREVFPATVRARRVQLHLFDGYWEDIGTVRAFYETNLSLCRPDPPFDLTMPEAPIYTRARFLPPSLLSGASIRDSLVAEGCRIGAGAVIENSVIGLRCVVGKGATIRDSVIMGADEYETAAELQRNGAAGCPTVGIGTGTIIERAIVDKNCRIGANVRIVNERGVESRDESDPCIVRDGIPVVVKDAVISDGWRL
jgi:glucose-1-phosphate adenylyltransferase